MSSFGGALWGGQAADGGGTAGVPLSQILIPAYRIAGITKRAGIQPSLDMYGEAIPELNRLLGLYNCDGHKIYSTAIESFGLTAGQKIYTIGPGGDFNTTRPLYIRGANLLFPTTPVFRRHLDVLDDDQWRAIAIQDLSGSPPYQIYYDGGDDGNGRGQIFVRFQPPAGYSIELYSWMRFQTTFSDASEIAVFPDGLLQVLVYQLAKQLAALNPELARMSPRSYEIADSSLSQWIVYNSKAPRIGCDPALCPDDSGTSSANRGWLDGGLG